MAVAPPPPVSFNPLKRVALELAAERRAGAMPPGATWPSVTRTRAVIRDPLTLLLDLYERHGPVFSVRVLHANNVFVLGPEANHFVLVSGAKHFGWRDGGFGDLIPLLGDGLLTIDGEFHKSSRRTMLPAFHRERIAGYRAVMEEEAARGVEGWRDGETLDVYGWARALALRVAMRALFGFDPDAGRGADDAARDFERALSFYGEDYWLQVLRGPRTPYARLMCSRTPARRARLRRDRAPPRVRRARGGRALAADGHRALRPARARPGDDAAVRRPRHDDRDDLVPVLGARAAAGLGRPRLRARRDAAAVPAGLDRPAPLAVVVRPARPPRPRGRARELLLVGLAPAAGRVGGSRTRSARSAFLPGEREKIPRGAYVPFGGGSRICLGMRFGQLEIGIIAAAIRERFTLERLPGHRLEIRQTPTLGPRGGLPMRVRTRRQ